MATMKDSKRKEEKSGMRCVEIFLPSLRGLACALQVELCGVALVGLVTYVVFFCSATEEWNRS